MFGKGPTFPNWMIKHAHEEVKELPKGKKMMTRKRALILITLLVIISSTVFALTKLVHPSHEESLNFAPTNHKLFPYEASFEILYI